jgi:hypothetical protein
LLFFKKKKISNETVSGKPYPVIKVMKRLIRQTDRQTDRQIGRQADRQRDSERKKRE